MHKYNNINNKNYQITGILMKLIVCSSWFTELWLLQWCFLSVLPCALTTGTGPVLQSVWATRGCGSCVWAPTPAPSPAPPARGAVAPSVQRHPKTRRTWGPHTRMQRGFASTTRHGDSDFWKSKAGGIEGGGAHLFFWVFFYYFKPPHQQPYAASHSRVFRLCSYLTNLQNSKINHSNQR